MGEQGHDEGHGLCRSAQPIKHRAFGGAERLVTLRTHEAPVSLRMDANVALANLASGRTRQIGAECCGGEHPKKKYVWTPVSFATSPHHGLVWSYPPFQCHGLFREKRERAYRPS